MPESSRRTDESLSRALGLVNGVLGHPAGILTDFDGTLAHIVSDPALARPVPGVADALERLAATGTVVAIVTGRAPFDARTMLGARNVLIVGNHGTEWLEPGSDATTSSQDSGDIGARLDAALARLPALDRVPIERKGLSASVHYRNATDPQAARGSILAALGDVAPLGIEVRHGRMSVELRPIGAGDKGTAAREVIARYGLGGVLVLGDDVTDLDMFLAVADLRDAGEVAAVIVGVGGGEGEVPPEVADAADVVLRDPEVAAALLASLS